MGKEGKRESIRRCGGKVGVMAAIIYSLLLITLPSADAENPPQTCAPNFTACSALTVWLSRSLASAPKA